MVIDRPHFYFTADKIKKWLAIAIAILFILMILTFSIIPEISVFFGVLFILSVVSWIILWFIT